MSESSRKILSEHSVSITNPRLLVLEALLELSDEFELILAKEIEKVQKKFNFEIKDHRVEMFGLCTDECSNCN